MLACFYEEVDKHFDERPLIIFTNGDQEALYKALHERYNSRNVVVKIFDDDTARNARQEFSKLPLGVFVIDPKYSRGLDLKCKVDAKVLILCHDRLFAESMVRQMVGRGSRSYGVGHATLFSYILKPYQQLTQMLRHYEESYYDGHLILRDFYESYPGIVGCRIREQVRMIMMKG